MLLSSKPYFIAVGTAKAFEVHRHPEIEISFCLEGEYDLICERKCYTLKRSEFALIPPMLSHEIPKNEQGGKVITIEVGSALLGEDFDIFSTQDTIFICNKETLSQNGAPHLELESLIRETAELYNSNHAFRELTIKGNLYKICALLLEWLNTSNLKNPKSKKMNDIQKIDQALEKIYDYYYEPLTVEKVSADCGYGKSNFCKIFKNITGNTFHHTLNQHRIEVACLLLKESNQTIEDIARDTGFADAKSFCRVFKSFMGQSAGEYRKNIKAR